MKKVTLTELYSFLNKQRVAGKNVPNLEYSFLQDLTEFINSILTENFDCASLIVESDNVEYTRIDTIDVLFRKDTEDNIFAIFPYEVQDLLGRVATYQHIGQHGVGHLDYMLEYNSVSADKSDYAELYLELVNDFDYNLNIIHDVNTQKYEDAYEKVKDQYRRN